MNEHTFQILLVILGTVLGVLVSNIKPISYHCKLHTCYYKWYIWKFFVYITLSKRERNIFLEVYNAKHIVEMENFPNGDVWIYHGRNDVSDIIKKLTTKSLLTLTSRDIVSIDGNISTCRPFNGTIDIGSALIGRYRTYRDVTFQDFMKSCTHPCSS